MKAELGDFIGQTVIEHWIPIVSALFVFCSSLVTITWIISNRLHKQEIRMLELQLTQQKEQFVQYESIVEQRINMLKEQVEKVGTSLGASDTVMKSEILTPDRNPNIRFSRKLIKDESKISHFISNTDYVSNLLSSIIRLL
ncbi:hypothetical protein GNP84_18840 [Aliivibrio fischeri]|uniref:hypothetical protein n=1 Tax=Aliivibrio fischeri TaxID=668 RepID=UPI0012D9B49A|nr:hypothetical protein [Aliivibrio fischeri]MUK78940.1 hypothetical protein [Aliivibrio fischeri]